MVAPPWALNTIKSLCSPKKWAKVHQKNFRGCYPVRRPIVPNFIEISQTSLEKSVKKRYLFGPSRRFLVTDGQKRDYLSGEARLRSKSPSDVNR